MISISTVAPAVAPGAGAAPPAAGLGAAPSPDAAGFDELFRQLSGGVLGEAAGWLEARPAATPPAPVAGGEGDSGAAAADGSNGSPLALVVPVAAPHWSSGAPLPQTTTAAGDVSAEPGSGPTVDGGNRRAALDRLAGLAFAGGGHRGAPGATGSGSGASGGEVPLSHGAAAQASITDEVTRHAVAVGESGATDGPDFNTLLRLAGPGLAPAEAGSLPAPLRQASGRSATASRGVAEILQTRGLQGTQSGPVAAVGAGGALPSGPVAAVGTGVALPSPNAMGVVPAPSVSGVASDSRIGNVGTAPGGDAWAAAGNAAVSAGPPRGVLRTVGEPHGVWPGLAAEPATEARSLVNVPAVAAGAAGLSTRTNQPALGPARGGLQSETPLAAPVVAMGAADSQNGGPNEPALQSAQTAVAALSRRGGELAWSTADAERGPGGSAVSAILAPGGVRTLDLPLGDSRVAPMDPLPGTGRVAQDVDALHSQLVQSLRVQWAGGEGEARVRLRPEYLGDVVATIKVEHGTVTATLQADTPEVRRWMEANAQTLRDALVEHGLKLDRLIVQSEPAPGEPREDQQNRPRGRQQTGEHPRQRRPREPHPESAFDLNSTDKDQP